MASNLKWKVYAGGIHYASTSTPHHASMIAAVLPNSSIKVNGRIVWTEGKTGYISDDRPLAVATMIDTAKKYDREAAKKIMDPETFSKIFGD